MRSHQIIGTGSGSVIAMAETGICDCCFDMNKNAKGCLKDAKKKEHTK